jgi:5'-deoxynucleotidase YfbR-like HD superfamily hydrolase
VNTWILTYSGRRVEPLSPRVDDIAIIDIAHALSQQCRWTGHTSEFYSVAQHSVMVADLVTNPEWKLHALLHDASEAYLCDIAKPVKETPTFAEYKVAEARLTDVIYEAMGLTMTPEIHNAIKVADRRLCATEGVQLVRGYRDALKDDTSNEGYQPYDQGF